MASANGGVGRELADAVAVMPRAAHVPQLSMTIGLRNWCQLQQQEDRMRRAPVIEAGTDLRAGRFVIM